jgi:hypothetical protein
MACSPFAPPDASVHPAFDGHWRAASASRQGQSAAPVSSLYPQPIAPMNRSLLLVVPLVLVLAACDTAEPALTAPGTDARGQTCVNVRHSGEALLGFPVIIPIDPANPLVGGGGLPTPTAIGPYVGVMSSILTSERQAGNGAVHYTLVHYFQEEGTGDDFWTEDRAVCAPVGTDPFTCLVNTNMEVVGGRGKFASASGRLHNRGLITISDPRAIRSGRSG